MLKNILICTDFSENAHQAALLAAELAKQNSARLILFHAYHPAILLEEDTIWADAEMLEKEVQEKIDALAHGLHQTYNLSVTRVLKPGFAVDEILAVSKKVKADLLIIGTEGAGRRPKNGPGKICTEVLKKAELPVVCVPQKTSASQFYTMMQQTDTSTIFGNETGQHLLKTHLQKQDNALRQIA